MEGVRQKVRQHEQEKFDREVEAEFQQIKLEMESVRIEVEPNDVEITTSRQCFFQHEITNNSPFAIVVRLRATSSYMFAVDKNAFRISQNQSYTFRITRLANKIRSHQIKLDVAKFEPSFDPVTLLDYFVGPYAYRTFVIRYHGAPRYWMDALEQNQWCPEDKELTGKVGLELKKSVKELKYSLDDNELKGDLITQATQTSDKEEPEGAIMDAADTKEGTSMNLVNVMLTAMQDLDEGAVSEIDSDLDYQDMDYLDLGSGANGVFEQLMSKQGADAQ